MPRGCQMVPYIPRDDVIDAYIGNLGNGSFVSKHTYLAPFPHGSLLGDEIAEAFIISKGVQGTGNML